MLHMAGGLLAQSSFKGTFKLGWPKGQIIVIYCALDLPCPPQDAHRHRQSVSAHNLERATFESIQARHRLAWYPSCRDLKFFLCVLVPKTQPLLPHIREQILAPTGVLRPACSRCTTTATTCAARPPTELLISRHFGLRHYPARRTRHKRRVRKRRPTHAAPSAKVVGRRCCWHCCWLWRGCLGSWIGPCITAPHVCAAAHRGERVGGGCGCGCGLSLGLGEIEGGVDGGRCRWRGRRSGGCGG